MSKEGFREELQHLINRESRENGSNTPDFILADYLAACLEAFDRAVTARTAWYSPAVPAPSEPPSGSTQGVPGAGAASERRAGPAKACCKQGAKLAEDWVERYKCPVHGWQDNPREAAGGAESEAEVDGAPPTASPIVAVGVPEGKPAGARDCLKCGVSSHGDTCYVCGEALSSTPPSAVEVIVAKLGRGRTPSGEGR